MLKLGVVLALAISLGGCAGVQGSKGNDTGGIIPWSPEAEAMALVTANNNCEWHGKYAVITSVRRVPGDYIAYQCNRKRD